MARKKKVASAELLETKDELVQAEDVVENTEENTVEDEPVVVAVKKKKPVAEKPEEPLFSINEVAPQVVVGWRPSWIYGLLAHGKHLGVSGLATREKIIQVIKSYGLKVK